MKVGIEMGETNWNKGRPEELGDRGPLLFALLFVRNRAFWEFFSISFFPTLHTFDWVT